jgi:hypothetical protein
MTALPIQPNIRGRTQLDKRAEHFISLFLSRDVKKGGANQNGRQRLQNSNFINLFRLIANGLLIGYFRAIGPHGAAYRRGKKGEKPALVHGVEYPGRQYADEKV